MRKIKLAIIFGGKSQEHEISLKSSQEVIKALDKEKYDITLVAITKEGRWLVGEKGQAYLQRNLPNAETEGGVAIEQAKNLASSDGENGLSKLSDGEKSPFDVVLPIGHGAFLEDGKLQGMLEMLGLPYVFSGTLASALAMNKQKTKLVAKSVGLKVAKEIVLKKGKKYFEKKIIAKLNFPIVIKPIESGSSVGMNIARAEKALTVGIEKAFEYSEEVMLEQFISGREFTVAVLGNKKPKALPVIEIIPKTSEFFDYAAKYQAGGSEEICPADIPEKIRKKVQKDAVKIFQALDCKDLARADFIWSDKDDKLYFLEINTIPGMTSASLAPKAAKTAGLGFPQFLDRLIKEAILRNKK
jgi:D-alanine-D-alanine ligase